MSIKNFKRTLAYKMADQYLTVEDLENLLVKSVQHVRRAKEEDELLFKELKAVEGFQDYLTETLANDKDRYFAASSPMEQLQTKGAYGRTLYLRSKLREPVAKVKLETPRTE